MQSININRKVEIVPINLTQLVETMHNIRRDRGLNPEHSTFSHLKFKIC